MSKANEPAFPVTLTPEWMDTPSDNAPDGLTKREYFAAQFLAAFIAADDHQHVALHTGEANNNFEAAAVRMADALIAELEKPPGRD